MNPTVVRAICYFAQCTEYEIEHLPHICHWKHGLKLFSEEEITWNCMKKNFDQMGFYSVLMKWTNHHYLLAQFFSFQTGQPSIWIHLIWLDFIFSWICLYFLEDFVFYSSFYQVEFELMLDFQHRISPHFDDN